MTQTFNMDCYDYMKALPDNAFDLVIADPPYGDCDGSCGGGCIDSRTTRGGSQDTGEAEVRSKVRQIQRPSRKSRWRGGWFQPYRKGSREGHGREDTTGVG